MAKWVLGIGALFLYGSLGVASVFASVPTESTRSSRLPVAPKEMSQEEKQRRQDECVTEHDYCYDWCTKSRRTKRDQALCYEDCAKKLARCMEKIPD